MDGLMEWAQQNNMTTREYHGEKTEIVSLVAYLTGVRYEMFENTVEPPQLEVYEKLENNRAARIVRNLCVLRTALLRNAGKIGQEAKNGHRNVFTVAEFVPQDAVIQLATDGVDLYGKNVGGAGKQKKKGSVKTYTPGSVEQSIVTLNRSIGDRLNNIKALFPIWLSWEYLRDIFVMPSGLTVEGVLAEKAMFSKNVDLYPYQVYINWSPTESGNVFFHDRKFVQLLYEWHNDQFTDISKVKSVQEPVKDEIYQFINDSRQLVLVVDCENSDAYKLCATLQDLDKEIVDKISKIILCDDEQYTPSAWRIFREHVTIPTDHIQCDRIKGDKSIVDFKLTAAVCKEFYANSVDSFVIVSSDSDYWGLISSLEGARFLLLVEHEKMSGSLRERLQDEGIVYAYIDDFYSGNSLDLAQHALVQEINKRLDTVLVPFNLHDFFKDVLFATGVFMSKAEKAQFYERYLKTLQVKISAEGNVSLSLNPR